MSGRRSPWLDRVAAVHRRAPRCSSRARRCWRWCRAAPTRSACGACCEELGYPVEALHVEHGLRGADGLADAAHCAGLGAIVVPVDLEDGPNLEARAREARYAAAREHAAGRTIATGHTLSDQAETVVYRLVSSSGARADPCDAPARGRRSSGRCCALTASETRSWCAGRGVGPRDDSTNDDRALRRNLIRHEVMPALRRVHPGAEVNLARSAELLGELDELLARAGRRPRRRADRPRLAGRAAPGAARAGAARGRRACRRAAAAPAAAADGQAGRTGRARAAASSGCRSAADLEAVRDRSSLSFDAAGAVSCPR